MAQTLLRDRARVFRKNGASLNDITQRLKVPKSTVRYWCRDIALSDAQLKRLFERQKLGGMRAAEKIRQRRLQLIRQLVQKGSSEIGIISPRELLLIGAALYWAEGYRKGDGEFGFTNSDPKMIRFIIQWLQKVCEIPKNQIHLRVCINEVYRKRIHKIQQFWSKVAGIPSNQFSKPTLIRVQNKKNYLNSSEYFGTLRIKVRNSTNLRRRIIGWIKGIATI